MTVSFVCPNPQGMSYAQWAAILVEGLAAYNVPRPADENSWRDWAVQVYAVPELTELGLTDPRGFPSWSDWAANVSQVTL